MMPDVCPICDAKNVRGPTCRRCRADLSLLREVEDYREQLLGWAARALSNGEVERAREFLAEAERVHPGLDTARLAAVAALIAREFDAAWRHYLQAGNLVREP